MTGIREGCLAIVLFLLTQLIICGIEEVLDRLPLDFSAPIIAMTLVFFFALLAGVVFGFDGTDKVYQKYLKEPVRILTSNDRASVGD